MTEIIPGSGIKETMGLRTFEDQQNVPAIKKLLESFKPKFGIPERFGRPQFYFSGTPLEPSVIRANCLHTNPDGTKCGVRVTVHVARDKTDPTTVNNWIFTDEPEYSRLSDSPCEECQKLAQ